MIQSKYDILQEKEQDAQKASQEIAQELECFLFPLLSVLDTLLDKRLVRTLVQGCVAISRFRNTKQGLLLSELGSYMDGYRGFSATATAGTKRISNLLRSLKWKILQIDRYVLEEAEKEVKTLKEQGKRARFQFSSQKTGHRDRNGRDDKSSVDELVEHQRR